ncbi:hypothetical protein KEM56_001234 [Ascosphaera pollenicola]|nr:hypothetical protein KEM56_001234 [Ascosphaera pollenicola]
MAIKTENEGSSAQDSKPVTPAVTQTPSSSPRKRTKATSGDDTPRKKAAASTKIPTTIDEASPEDKMLLRMRDEGRSWAEIREAWANATGTKVSTGKYLNMRYARIRANLTVVDEEDVRGFLVVLELESIGVRFAKLLRVDYRYRGFCRRKRPLRRNSRGKYARIAKAIADAGGKGYEAAVVQKKIKELVKNGAFDGLP